VLATGVRPHGPAAELPIKNQMSWPCTLTGFRAEQLIGVVSAERRQRRELERVARTDSLIGPANRHVLHGWGGGGGGGPGAGGRLSRLTGRSR
jgi:hypothetical protein